MTVRRNGLAKGELALRGVSSSARPREDRHPPVVVDLRGELTFAEMTAAMVAGEREAARIGTRILLVTADAATRYEGNRRAHRATSANRRTA